MATKIVMFAFLAIALFQVTSFVNADDGALATALAGVVTNLAPLQQWAGPHINLIQTSLTYEGVVVPQWTNCAENLKAGNATGAQMKTTGNQVLSFYYMGLVMLQDMKDVIAPAGQYLDGVKALGDKLISESASRK